MSSGSLLVPCCVGGLSALFGALVSATYVFFQKNHLLVRAYFRIFFWRENYKLRNVKAGRYTYSYLERGKQKIGNPTMLFLHGFTTSKDSWLPIAKRVPRDDHVIILDLPGHGSSSIPADDDTLTIDTLTEDLHNFVQGVGLKQFHLIGISMGGAISENYAVQYPDELRLLTLICPAMRTPHETNFQREVREGKCMLIVDNVEGLANIIQHTTYSKPKLYAPVLKGILTLRLPRNGYYRRLFHEIHKLDSGQEGRDFEEKVRHISQPTHIVWGKQDDVLDISGAELLHSRLPNCVQVTQQFMTRYLVFKRVLDVSGAELLRSRLPNCVQVDILESCGHSCGMDRPGALTKALVTYRASQLKHKTS